MSEFETDPSAGTARQHFVVVSVGQTPGDALATVDENAALIRRAAEQGALWIKQRKLNGQLAKLVRLRDLDQRVLDGSELFLNLNEAVLSHRVEPPTLLREESNYSFWYKPRGVLSQGSKWGDHTSMPYLVSAHTGKPAHLVHRLDRFACGVMVIAHTRPSVKALTALFAKRRVVKRYRALVAGKFEQPLPWQCTEPVDDARAVTEITSSKYDEFNHQSTLGIELHTGRKHQIRRHLANMQLPIVGDKRYSDAPNGNELSLMAIELSFQCPFSNKAVRCTVPSHLQAHLLHPSSYEPR